jgi:hypothetical protein
MFNKLTKRFRQAASLWKVKRLFRRRCGSIAPDRKTVVLDFRKADVFFRYQFSIALAFKMSGWNVVWIFRPKMFLQSWEFQANLEWAEKCGIYWCLRNPKSLAKGSSSCFLITDGEGSRIEHFHRLIQLKSLDSSSIVNERDVIVPFFGYPEFLLKSWDPSGLANRPRARFRVAFVGNCDPKKYSERVSNLCSVTRAGAKALLLREFAPELMSIDLWDDKRKLGKNETAKFLFSDALRAFLYLDEYINVLLSADFFLVLPGIASSLTHSLYESVFCGCIPILGQCEEYQGVWQDRKNCLMYHDEASLVSSVKLALAMSEDQVLELRHQAKQTFEQNFAFPQFAERVEKSETSVIWCRNV